MDFIDIKHRLDDADHRRIRKQWCGLSSEDSVSRMIESCRADDNRRLWGFVEDGRIISTAEFCIRDGGLLYIAGFAVDRPRQRQGIGRAMIYALRDMYGLPIELETDDGAIEFYRKCGFITREFLEERDGKPYRRWRCVLKGSVPAVTLCLIKPDDTHKEMYLDMLSEWQSFDGQPVPGALRNNGRPYETWLQWIEDDAHSDSCPRGATPQTMYFAIRSDGRLIGAAAVRHKLTDDMIQSGVGHIEYGVRPSERHSGYAPQILRMALDRCAERGIFDVILSCTAGNAQSENTLRACGAEYTGEIARKNGECIKTYKIKPYANR